MYAVIKTGGKQYRVQEGDVLKVELIGGEKGAKITFKDVLMVGGSDQPKVGRPLVEGASVEAEVVDPKAKGPKVLHFIKNYFGFTRRQGHRQKYTEVKVTGIRA
ncbi:MAG: 50S ribosomal protein L21 [Myxococcales bacterium]